MGIILLFAFAAPAFGQGTSFTYQGRLTDGGTPANGNYDFIFQLYDAIDGDNLLGHEVSVPAVLVTDGIFSVTLDFGANAFPGADRFLQIIVRRTGDPGIPTLLSPRQKLTSTPYAIRSLSALTADNAVNATQLGGTAASQFVLTGDARLSDARPPISGSSNYIQNGTSPQASSDFNITGTGRANSFDANQFSLLGARVLSNAGTSNLFAGQGAGQANNLGNRNAFFGSNSGFANTIGELNSFFGNSAGQTNKEGRSNDFFGDSAGLFNSSGSYNSIFGSQAGTQNTTGANNTFIGNYAGQTNTTGNGNTIVGYLGNVLSPGLNNATAIGANARVDASNSLVLGSINGVNGATADTNVGIGTTSPQVRLHVVGNSLIEGNLNVGGTINGNFSGTIQTANNALSLGGVVASQYVQTGDARLSDARPPAPGSANYIQNGTTQQPATNFNVSGAGQADSFDAATQFKLNGVRVLSNAGTSNFFAGPGAGQANAGGSSNSFFGSNAGAANDAGNLNSFFGNSAGLINTSGSFNAFFGSGSGRANVDGNNNAFFGYTSGRNNASGFNNSFFGNAAGLGTTNGGNNSFFGWSSGKNNTLGQQNTFVGTNSGITNLTGGNNTLLGYGTDVGAPDNSNATAIGAQAFVAQANSLVLGAINGVNGANFDTNVGIGTTAPAVRLHVVGDGLFTGNLTVQGNLNGNFSLNTVNAVTQYNLGGSRILAGDTTANNFFSGFGTGSSITTGTKNTFFGSLAGVLTSSGGQNSFFGVQAGNQNSTGTGNSFFGAQAGKQNTGGNANSFFGGNAGLNNATGGDNSYFGVNAGANGTSGSFNSFFGELAGLNNNTAFNSFFGYGAGQQTSSGAFNTFFGQNTGNLNTTGQQNSYFGTQAGASSNGSFNAFFGTAAGGHSLTGSGNSAFGSFADTASGALNNATAIGNRAFVSASNSLVLGGISGINSCTVANSCSDTNVGIGTTAPTARLHVVGDGLFTGNLTVNGTLNANFAPGNANYIQNTTTPQATSNFNISGDGTAGGTLSGNAINATSQYRIGGTRILFSNAGGDSLFAGFSAGGFNTGTQNTFLGTQAGALNDAGNNNVFVGFQAGDNNTTGSSNTAIGRRADVGSNNLDHATAIGAEAVVASSNTIVLGRNAGQDTVQIPGDLAVNGTLSAPGGTVSSSILNAATQFNLSDNRVLTISGAQSNTTVGIQAGNANPSSTSNSFFGYKAGLSTTIGGANSFFGDSAGSTNQNGGANAFFGYHAGAGNLSGSNNTFIGFSAGGSNSIGGGNSFFGLSAGAANTSGNANTAIGDQADVASGNLTNATAIGAYAQVARSNSLVLGGISGLNNCVAPVCGDTNIGIGNNVPIFKLHIVDQSNTGLRVQTNAGGGTVASFGGNGAFQIDAPGITAGRLNILENGNVGINTGSTDPEQRLQVNGQVLSTGAQAGFKFRDPDSNQDWTWHASVTGPETVARLSFNGLDYLTVSSSSSQPQNTEVATPGSVSVGNTADLQQILLRHLPVGGSTPICRDDSTLFLGNCSSSLRYKTNLAPFSSGLSFIRQLQPISFDWKTTGRRDIGFGAEDVAKINPLFVTYNETGQIEGVKYDRFSTVFVNAFKEQQLQIEQLREQIEKQQTQIDALKKLVCADHPNADICKQ